MVSGTPLCSKIEDLHGELNFLKVWPFCLSNRQDGFWDLKIGKPYREREESALTLLHSLMDAVMMRHSKSQICVDGTPIISIVGRKIEWRPFAIENNSEQYLLKYLEAFAADALVAFLRTPVEGSDITALPHYGILKSLVGLMSRCITGARTLDLRHLDHVRRLLLGTRLTHSQAPSRGNGGKVEGGVGGWDTFQVPLMTAEQILHLLQQSGQGLNGGMNRYSTT